jgi:hypothetical protein
MPTIPRSAFGLLLTLGLSAAACDDTTSGTGSIDDGNGGDDSTGAGNGNGNGGNGDGGGTSEPQVDPALEARVVDYNEALRKASLKLVRRLPTLEQIRRVENAADGREAYEAELDAMLASPEFTVQTLKMWRDIMRMGGDGLDTAPAFAAKIMAENRDFTELFTATAGNCPTLDTATGTFTEGDCASGAPFQAGLLTNQDVMRQFYGNMAFRRARWVQETFYCSKFPAEVAAEPEVIDGKDYVSPWAFDRISNTPINFLDTASVVCANCHATMNRIAPVFAHFDEDGMWTDGFSVMTPIAPEPVPTELSHWLPEGEALAWRVGQEVTTVADLGALLAEDPLVTECMTARLWNFAFGKEDIVRDLATVPFKVVEPHVLELDQTRDLKATLRGIFVSEDFVSF